MEGSEEEDHILTHDDEEIYDDGMEEDGDVKKSMIVDGEANGGAELVRWTFSGVPVSQTCHTSLTSQLQTAEKGSC